MSSSPAGRLYNLDSTFVTISGAAETVRVQGERLQAQLSNDGSLILTSTSKTTNRERRRTEARNVHQSIIDRHASALAKLLETIESVSRDIETGACNNAEVGGQQLTKLIVQKGKLVRRIAELEATPTLTVAYSEVESGTTVTLLPGIVTATFLGLPVIWCPRPLLAAEQHEEIPASGPIPVIPEGKADHPVVVTSLPTPTVKSKPPPSPMVFPITVESKSPFFAALSTSATALDLSAGVSSSSPALLGFGTFDFNAPPATRQSSTSSELKEEEGGGEGEGADEGECTATFAPVVRLTETKVDSGEGDEDCIYQQMSLLYRFEPTEQAWKTRGKGYVKLMKHRVTQQVRLVLREDKTLKVRMNHRVNPLVELKANGEKAWTWATTDYSEDQQGSEQTFSIKFGTVELAKEFKVKHDEARNICRAADKGCPPVKPQIPNVEPKIASPAAMPVPICAPVSVGKTTEKQEEKCLYEEKCLMYCYDAVEKKWPAAKTGQAKLLQHQNGQVRIVVQETPTKLCLNHLVNPSVELKPNAGSDKSWTWAAVDYAVAPEGAQNTFAIKFRTAEQSTFFKRKHDEAKSENARGGFETGAPLGEAAEENLTKAFGDLAFGSPSKDLGPISSAIFSSFTTPTTITSTIGSTAPFSGFGSFGTTSSSPFSFTGFGSSTTTTGFSFSSNAFSFATPVTTAPITTAQDSAAEPSDEYFGGGAEGGDDATVEAECTATYTPVVKLTEKQVDSGESNEDCTYSQMCLLYRFDNEEKAWKTRGKGLVKLLQHRVSNKFRVVLREDKTLKVRMNHSVHPLVELKPVNGSEKSWMWSTLDYAEDEPITQTFSITFSTAELAKEFKAKHDEARLQNGGTVAAKPFVAPPKPPTPEQPKVADFAPSAPAPVKNAFQQLKDSSDWVCSVCEVDNKTDAVKCRSCDNPNPKAPAAAPSTASSASAFTFGTPFTFGAPLSGGVALAPGGPTGFTFSSTVPFTFGSSTSSINFPSSEKQDGGDADDADEGDEGDAYDEGDFGGDEGDFGDENGE